MILKINTRLFLMFLLSAINCLSCSKKDIEEAAKLERSVVLDIKTATIKVGENVKLKADFGLVTTPLRKYKWSTSNNDIVSVEDEGNWQATVTAKRQGIAIVHFQSEDGVVSATSTIEVTPTEQLGLEQSVVLDKSTAAIEIGERTQLQADFGAITTPLRRYQWSTSNSSVVTVEQQDNHRATITGVSEGNAVIQYRSEDGVVSATCNVEVKTPKLKIILKLDDLGSNNFNSFKPIMDLLLERKIKASFGIIAMRLDNTAPANLDTYIKAKNEKGENLFEFWHHGWDHSGTAGAANVSEFHKSSPAQQKENFDKANDRVKELLGIQMRTFGAPFNITDKAFDNVISANTNYNVFFLPAWHTNPADRISTNLPGMVYLGNRVDMEGNPTTGTASAGAVNFDYFMARYNANKERYKDNMVLQGHPASWGTQGRMAEFQKILDFLVAQGYEFELPYNYAARILGR